jgi:ABC-type polysaccharide/polyol phosphate export permease
MGQEQDAAECDPLSYQLDLIIHLVQRSFLLRYKGSVLGALWSLLLPLAQLIVLVFLFRKVVPLNIDAYPAFVFTALLPWNWFGVAVSSAGGLFLGNRDLVRRPNFTPWILTIVNTLSHLLTYLLFLPVLFVFLLLWGREVTPWLLLLPLLILMQGVLIAGLGLIIGTLNVFYRDVEHIVSVAVMLLFYLTPVFYRSDMVGEKYRLLYILNPMAVLIESYRAILYHAAAPEWNSLLVAGSVCLGVCGLGYLVYQYQLHNVFDTL